jgi:hypothetical protein
VRDPKGGRDRGCDIRQLGNTDDCGVCVPGHCLMSALGFT